MPINPKVKKPPLAASLCFFVALAILISLGMWQYQRLEWKEKWLEQIENAYQTESSDLPALSVQDFETGGDALRYKRGTITGHFLPFTQKLTVRTVQGQAGYHAIGLFEITGADKPVIINMGWRKMGEPSPPPPENTITLTGVIRLADMPHFLTPDFENNSDVIYAVVPQDIANAAGLKSVPPPASFFIDSPWAMDDIYTPHDQTWRPNNNHLHYAIFWFSLAMVLCVIFVMRFMRH